MQTESLVVHYKRSKYDEYIGRPYKTTKFHYGNPFSHLDGSKAVVIVASREEAVQAYEDWLLGKAWFDIEQEQRLWILDNLIKLRGKVLGCWCAPLACHGDVLVKLIDVLMYSW